MPRDDVVIVAIVVVLLIAVNRCLKHRESDRPRSRNWQHVLVVAWSAEQVLGIGLVSSESHFVAHMRTVELAIQAHSREVARRRDRHVALAEHEEVHPNLAHLFGARSMSINVFGFA